MKQRLVLLTIVLMFLGTMYVPTSSGVTPVNGLATGDTFQFTGDGQEYENLYRYAESTNVTDGTLMHYDEEGSLRDLSISETSDVFIIKQRSILPPIDTAVDVENEGQFDSGSYEEFFRNATFYNDDIGGLDWDNYTDYRDLSGMEIHDKGQEEGPQQLRSNSTYALIFPDMTVNQFDVPMDGEGFPFNTTFDWTIPLNYRTISSGTADYSINGATQSVNYSNVSQNFYVYFQEDSIIEMPFGDPFDPNTPTALVNMSLTIEISITTYYVYDTANNMLVEIGEVSDFSVDAVFWGDDITIDWEPDNPDYGEMTFDFDSAMEMNSSRSHVSTMSEASAFYGNTRPESSGSNALEEDDTLVYFFESFEGSGLTFESTHGEYSEFEQIWYEQETEGDLYLDLYRHSNTGFDAIAFLDGESWGYFEEYREYTDENGNAMVDDFSDSFGPYPTNFFDHLSATTTSDYEFKPPHPEQMEFRDFFRCDGPDCGSGDYYPEFPHDALRTSTTENVTDWFVDLPSMGEDPVVINGNNFYYFNATTYQYNYERHETLTIDIPIDEQNGIWEQATMDIDYFGVSAIHIDDDTSAVVGIEEWFEGTVHIYGEWDIQYEDHTVTVTIDAWLDSEYDTSLFLSEHPHHYQVGQEPPVDNPDTNDTVDEPEDTAGLSLPIPIGSVFAAVTMVTVFTYSRKR